MGMFSAASDRDYADECHGPYGQTVIATCEACGEAFRSAVDRQFGPDRLCERCEAADRAAHASRRCPELAMKDEE